MTRLQEVVRAVARQVVKADAVMPIVLRPACAEDFAFCARLYFSAMKNIIRELQLDVTKQEENLRHLWDVAQVRIITTDDVDAGWMQSEAREDGLYLEQIFVDAPFRRRGIGTSVINGLITQANHTNKPVTLAVVRSNPALKLYERMGFRIADEDDRKFYMRRAPDGAGGQ
ncbi:MAG: GNAT family N-acetyltransferase [Afipia sp.]